MKLLLAILLTLCLHAGAGQPPPSTWKLYSWGNNGLYQPTSAPGVGGDVSTFTFPIIKHATAYPAFLTTTVDTSLLGDLTGQTLSAMLTLSTTGSPAFRYGGQGTWNTNCPSVPANTRLFISSSPDTYNLNYAGQHEDEFWWSHGGVANISAQTGTVTISDTFDPANWSNANGHSAVDRLAAFQAAVANVQQIGLSYGGGCFFDTGIAVLPTPTGTATFHLVSFAAQ